MTERCFVCEEEFEPWDLNIDGECEECARDKAWQAKKLPARDRPAV